MSCRMCGMKTKGRAACGPAGGGRGPGRGRRRAGVARPIFNFINKAVVDVFNCQFIFFDFSAQHHST